MTAGGRPLIDPLVGYSTHLILDLYGCAPQLLDDIDHVERTIGDAAADVRAPILGQVFHRFSPVGVTGVAVMAFSNISVHTWPQYGYAAVDIFSAGPIDGLHQAARLIIENLRCLDPRTREIVRGAAVEDRDGLGGGTGRSIASDPHL